MLFGITLFKEDCLITHYKDVEYDYRQDVGCIEADPFGERYAFAGVCFLHEVIPAPTITTGAEGEVNKAAQREQVVTY